MARNVVCVTTMTADLTVESPLRIGGSGTASSDDTAVFRDACERPILPGTSLAGALRANLGASEVEADEAGSWWGAARGTHVGASRVSVFDAEIVLPSYGLGRRDGVAINRATGSAVDGLLYGFEVVPTGARATVTIEVESITGTEEADLQLLANIRALLVRGLWLGARTTRGFGEVRASTDNIEVRQRRYDEVARFWSTRSEPASPQLPGVSPTVSDTIEIEIGWHPEGPVAVGRRDLVDGIALVPLMERRGGGDRLHLVMPGTSIAGALRSRAEMICRTIDQTPPSDDFDGQLAANPLVQRLFGASAGSFDDASWSALQTFDCMSKQSISANTWEVERSNLAAQKARPRRILGRGGAELRRTEHVAVDRWTGGASEGRLFSELEPHGFEFEPLRLRLHVSRLGESPDAATMLLMVTLRELCAGRVPLGAKTMRGLGGIGVSRVQMKGRGLDIDGDFPDLRSEPFATWRSAWRESFTQQGSA